jgi:hypothetical protein
MYPSAPDAAVQESETPLQFAVMFNPVGAAGGVQPPQLDKSMPST